MLSLFLLSSLFGDSLIFLLGGPEVPDASSNRDSLGDESNGGRDCILSKSFRTSASAAFGAANRNAINPIARAKVRPESVAKSKQHATSTVPLAAAIGVKLVFDVSARHAAPPVMAHPEEPAAM